MFLRQNLLQALLFAWEKGDRLVVFNGCYPDRFTIEQIVETFKSLYFPKAKSLLLPVSLS